MTDRVWDWWDDFLEAAGGVAGIVAGFVLPVVGVILAVGVLAGWWVMTDRSEPVFIGWPTEGVMYMRGSTLPRVSTERW